MTADLPEATHGWRRAAAAQGPVCALAAVIVAAIAARAWLLFSTALVPGMNGGYYLVQARALLEKGALGIPDLPLTFALHAALARALQWLTGNGLETSIVLAVKLADAVLPPFVALPVFLAGRMWCRRLGRAAWLPVLAAAVVALNPAALFITGDLQKNSLGHVWLAGLVAALLAWLTHRSARNAVAALALLGLAGLTHIGVFGVALLLTALTLVVGFLLPGAAHGGARLRRPWPWAAGGLAVTALAAGLVMWKFDPARAQRLVGAFTDPAAFLQHGQRPPGGPPMDKGPAGALPMRPPPGGPGPGMPAFLMPRWTTPVVFGGVAVGALVMLWRRRRELSGADHAVVIGCAATVLLVTGPWVQGDTERRLSLIATVPATFAGMFALAHAGIRWLQPFVAGAAVVLLAGRAVPLLAHGGQPILSEAAYEELAALVPRIAQPQRTLVVARHGLEWWAAWALHTRVAQMKALRAEDWSAYGEVLFLQSKEEGDGFARRRLPAGRFPGLPPSGFPGRGAPPPMMEASFPPDADMLHDGPRFKLARVGAPPPFLSRHARGDNPGG
jgi:hypothetical protein